MFQRFEVIENYNSISKIKPIIYLYLLTPSVKKEHAQNWIY